MMSQYSPSWRREGSGRAEGWREGGGWREELRLRKVAAHRKAGVEVPAQVAHGEEADVAAAEAEGGAGGLPVGHGLAHHFVGELKIKVVCLFVCLLV